MQSNLQFKSRNAKCFYYVYSIHMAELVTLITYKGEVYIFQLYYVLRQMKKIAHCKGVSANVLAQLLRSHIFWKSRWLLLDYYLRILLNCDDYQNHFSFLQASQFLKFKRQTFIGLGNQTSL